MSVNIHSFAPLLLRRKEPPMHNQHCRSLIDTTSQKLWEVTNTIRGNNISRHTVPTYILSKLYVFCQGKCQLTVFFIHDKHTTFYGRLRVLSLYRGYKFSILRVFLSQKQSFSQKSYTGSDVRTYVRCTTIILFGGNGGKSKNRPKLRWWDFWWVHNMILHYIPS